MTSFIFIRNLPLRRSGARPAYLSAGHATYTNDAGGAARPLDRSAGGDALLKGDMIANDAPVARFFGALLAQADDRDRVWSA